ncbi:MAG TPA: HNH endonuclease [Sphingomicrobium sp.]|jgi:5-methylcytosine-specific restriction endonuclease McrA
MGDHEASCWLCGRPIGTRVEYHHPLPKSRGGRETVPVHPICHRTLHKSFTNKELAVLPVDELRAKPELAAFLRWIASKPPDFHAPTHRRR